MPNLYKNPWFHIKKPAPQAVIRLFCFPYAGGSAQIFSDWCNSLPDSVEVIAVQYPGRGSRFVDPLIGTCKGMVEALIPNILPALDKPFVFFGHSNGGLVSFELARALYQQGVRQQIHHFISAKRAIHLPQTRKPMHAMGEQEFLKAVEELGGTPPEILAQKELMELFTPILRSDFSLSETFAYEGEHKLACDATLLYGLQDEDVPVEDVLQWQELIENKVQTQEFTDGHFFINSQKEQLLAYLNQRLNTLAQRVKMKMMA